MSDGPWLSAAEQRAWRSYLAMHLCLERHLERHLQAGFGLSAPDFEILVNLSEAPGQRMRAFALAEATGWEKSRLSHHLNRMEKRGLVRRDAGGSRYPEIVLTDTGLAAIEASAPANAALVRTVFIDVLGPKRLSQLREAADDVIAAIERDCHDPAPNVRKSGS